MCSLPSPLSPGGRASVAVAACTGAKQQLLRLAWMQFARPGELQRCQTEINPYGLQDGGCLWATGLDHVSSCLNFPASALGSAAFGS